MGMALRRDCFFVLTFIGVVPLTQLRTCVIEIVHIPGKSHNVLISNFHAIRNFSLRKELAPTGSEFFPLREVPILKRDAIDENHCSF